LPPENSYTEDTIVAEFISLPYSEYAKLILKVSYNICAETALMLYGITQGVNTIDDSLDAERKTLIESFGINDNEFDFIDGSGGGVTVATGKANIKLLEGMAGKDMFPEYFDALPVLAVDGSLASITDFESDPTLAGAKGNVRAKTGTFVLGAENGLDLRARGLAGYIDTKSGKRLIFSLILNDVGVLPGFAEIGEVMQDGGRIAAIIWKEN